MRRRLVVVSLAGAVALAAASSSSCGSGGGESDDVAEPAEITAFCDALRASGGKSIQQTWVALQGVAPTSEIRAALDSMVSLNDPEGRSHGKVDEFAGEHCGAEVPGRR